jgi:hypothetical protein
LSGTSKPAFGCRYEDTLYTVRAAIHHPLEIAQDTFPSGEILMKALAPVIALVLALGASGCVSKQQTVGAASVGLGIVPKTRLIMARLD